MVKNFICGLLSACIIISMAGCSKSSLYTSSSKNYKRITCVPGIEFEINSSLVNSATAVTTISNSADYSGNTYSYTDGSSTYLLFNMSSFVVALQTGTQFQPSKSADMENTIESSDICGIRFSKNDKSLNYKTDKSDDAYKMIADVHTNVSITRDLYGKFVGQLAVISKGSREVSLFVGYLGDSMKDISSSDRKTIEHITRSLIITYECLYEESVVAATGNVKKHMEETNNGYLNSLQSDEDVLEALEVENKPSIISEIKVKDRGKAESGSESSLYRLLEIGDTGLCDALGKKVELVEQEITIEKLYIEKKAENKIKDLCAELGKKYREPCRGNSYHLIKYSLKKSPKDCYTDIRIKGFDGGKLTYIGVQHTARTYDLIGNIHIAKDGKYCNLYCYYEVPNGCKEYMLQCGTASPNDQARNAYYKVSKY